jgi:hypothetical protein
MKVTNAVLVGVALLLRASSVEAFQQSSTGYFNTLTRTSSKSTPMHGYLDSLGHTATVYKDNASSEGFLPRRYEAEYPPRHDFSNVAVYPVVQQSEPTSPQASSKASTGTETGSTSMYQYGQGTGPSELVGNAYVNMMGAPEMVTEPTRTIEDTPKPDIIVHTTAKTPKARTAIETPMLRSDQAVSAAGEIVKRECW